MGVARWVNLSDLAAGGKMKWGCGWSASDRGQPPPQNNLGPPIHSAGSGRGFALASHMHASGLSHGL